MSHKPVLNTTQQLWDAMYSVGLLEGWVPIVSYGGASDRHYFIERDDEAGIFASDEEAIKHVRKLANAGSEIHRLACQVHGLPEDAVLISETPINLSKARVSRISGIKLHAPELFARQDFQEWLNSSKNTMTWHDRSQPITRDSWSDVAVFFDPSMTGEGTDDDMPGWDEVFKKLKSVVGEGPHGGEHFVVILTQME